MKIAFMQVGEQPHVLAFLASVAGHELWHLTDEETPALPGCEVLRLPRNGDGLMAFRGRLYAEFNQPGLYCDTDMLFIRDPTPVMGLDFDVAVTKRNHAIYDPHGVDLTKAMPYNAGVVFVKDLTYWPACLEKIRGYDAGLQKWYGDQLAMAECATGRDIVELPVKLYNYSPSARHEDVSKRWVLHFKGAVRKEWMFDYRIR